MLKTLKRFSIVLFAAALLICVGFSVTSTSVYAESDNRTQITTDNETATLADEEVSTGEQTTDNAKSSKAIAAAIAVGLAAALGALAMGIAIGKSNEAIARQPEATSEIKSGLMLGLVFIETAIIYALIVAILVIFVL